VTVRADDLGAVPPAAMRNCHASLDPEAAEGVVFGCADQACEDNRDVAPMALLPAGRPAAVTGTTINRLCNLLWGSGLEAVLVASMLRARQMRSMSALRCGPITSVEISQPDDR
jgi:acetyl-CoA acyltransferase